ncbi:hypothetical protein KP79_PYT17051 [Mizuhopecten yessoensis]|uniref:Methyltransferase type 11 domain-containing protein n=1 Tax=Mizuhopecten yessoensis TaxID=6573 RepID=A0A210R1Z9_MIZYE|nr:hypothetical protein KP79_PYT17051 [Mizuhopecten yessoensis]
MDKEKVETLACKSALYYYGKACNYDEESEALGYKGPSTAARALARIFQNDRKNRVILDIGGGTDSYDAVLGVSIICSLQPGFMCSDIKEMIRLAKPGGIILMILRTETLYYHFFKDKLIPFFDELQSEEKWKQLERSQFKYMYGVEGQLFVYQKL